MEELESIAKKTLNSVEQEAKMLDDLSRILGRIEADISTLKDGQEQITNKLNAIEPRLAKTELSSAVGNKIGAGGWALFLALVGSIFAYLIK